MLEKRLKKIRIPFDKYEFDAKVKPRASWGRRDARKKDLKKIESEFDKRRKDAKLKARAVRKATQSYAARESSSDDQGKEPVVFCPWELMRFGTGDGLWKLNSAMNPSHDFEIERLRNRSTKKSEPVVQVCDKMQILENSYWGRLIGVINFVWRVWSWLRTNAGGMD